MANCRASPTKFIFISFGHSGGPSEILTVNYTFLNSQLVPHRTTGHCDYDVIYSSDINSKIFPRPHSRNRIIAAEIILKFSRPHTPREKLTRKISFREKQMRQFICASRFLAHNSFFHKHVFGITFSLFCGRDIHALFQGFPGFWFGRGGVSEKTSHESWDLRSCVSFYPRYTFLNIQILNNR